MRRKCNEAQTNNRSLGFFFRFIEEGVVRERSVCSEGPPKGRAGAIRSENAGISNEIEVRILNPE